MEENTEGTVRTGLDILADLNGSDNAEYREHPRTFYSGRAHKYNEHFQGYNYQIKKHVTGFNVQCTIFVFFFQKKKKKKKKKRKVVGLGLLNF